MQQEPQSESTRFHFKKFTGFALQVTFKFHNYNT